MDDPIENCNEMAIDPDDEPTSWQPFWNRLRDEHPVPEGALTEIWTSPPDNNCMFTARPDFDPVLARRFAEALSALSY